VMSPILNQSSTTKDALTGPNSCGAGLNPLGGIQGRCGYGPRQPFLVISPYAKVNFVDSTPTDQSSVIRFIEDNWLGGQRLGGGSFDVLSGSVMNLFDFSHLNPHKLFLNPQTGEPM